MRVTPDFQDGKNAVRFHVRVRIRLLFLVLAALSALTGFVKLYLKIKKHSGPTGRQEKAVL